VSRFAAIFAHYRRTLDASTRRLSTFLDRAAQASRVGAEFDDAASAQGLVNLFLHGHACGALDDRDLERAGVDTTSLATRSFTAIVEARARSHSMREK
jgi:hypothetical protein